MEIFDFGSQDDELARARLALLIERFSELSDDREPQRIMYPLHEVLLLVSCATIASCDDFDDIVLWGEHHLDFLRRFSAFDFGIPARVGFALSSTASIRRCSPVVLKVGRPPCGRIATTSSPSTARRRVAPMISARG